MAQFVPIKLDTGTEEWRQFEREHPSTGRGIPKLYIVRADGETFYAKSGLLSVDELGQLLTASLNHAGRILSDREIDTLRRANQEIAELRSRGDVAGAIRLLRKLKKIGTPGELGSYATDALELDRHVQELTDEGRGAIAEVKSALAAAENEEQQLTALRNHLGITDRYGGLATLKNDFGAVKKQISRDKVARERLRGVRVIEAAEAATSRNAKSRAITKLESLLEQLQPGPLADQATRVAQRLRKEVGN